MNLYLVKRTTRVGYDEYDSFVVAADHDDDSKLVANNHGWGDAGYQADLKCELIGTAKPFTKRGVILGSYNAG